MARSRSGSKSRGNNFTKNDIEKSDFLVLRDSATGVIKKVIAPNGLQVGLLDENFLADVFVTGHISGSGVIRSKQGFTGSLTKLHTGGDYLKAGTNISLTTGSDGSVTISTAASFTGTTTEVLTIGDGLQLDSGTTFDGSAAKTLSVDLKSAGGLGIDSEELYVDIPSQTNVTAATGDYVLIADADDSFAIKRTTVGSIQSVTGIDINSLSSFSSLNYLDNIAVEDISDSNTTKKTTLANLGTFLASAANGGIGSYLGGLTLDMDDLSSGVVSVGSDSFSFIDADDNTTKKESISDLVDAMRGTTTTTGLNSSSGVLSVDINSMTSVGTLSTSDEVLIYDADAAALRKATVSDIQNLGLDLDTLSAATIDVSADLFAFIDTDDSNASKKESVADLIGAIAGSGLTATSGQLSLTDSSVTITAGDGLKDGGSVSLGGSVTLNVDVSDFAGTGLEDDGSENLRIASSGIGTGLSGGSGTAISVDFGNTSTQVAKGSNTITLVPGDGLTTGGTATIGNAATNLTVDINPTDFAGTGLKVVSNDLVIDDSIVATLTGSTFSGDLIVTGSVYATGILSGSSVKATKLSGSLTTLADGSPYLIAGDNILITTGSSGAITITGSSYTAGTGLNLNGYEFSVDNSIVATLTGSQFSGNVGVTGSLGVTSFVTSSIFRGASLSGSLTTLQDGSAYLRAGNNITITTSSLGFITITSTATGSVSGSNTSFLNITASNGLTGTLANSGSNLELQIDNSVVATLTGSIFTGNVIFESGVSGSLQALSDGTAYIVGTGSIDVSTGSNGQIIISGSVVSETNPASPVNSVQFNNSGIFGGDSDFVYDSSNNVLTLSGTIQQLTASIFSTDYSGSVSLVVAHDLDSNLTFRLPEQDGLKFQFLQTDSDGNLSFDYSDRVHIQVRNNSGYDLDAGTPIYITGYNSGGDRAYIAASSASLDSTMPAAAILAEDLNNNSNGHAALIGFLEGVDTSLFTVGNTLYVAADGGLTDSKPLDSDVLIQNVGFVLKAANNGIMYVTSPGRTNDVPNNLIGRAGLSGSLQMLADGVTRYLIGTGSVSVSTSSNGQVVVSGSDTIYTAGTGLDLTDYQFSIDDSVVATLTGSTFSGNVIAPAFSGSLTHLQDGTSYLIAGSNVTISTGSNGAVTISSSGGGGGSITTVSGSTSVSNVSTIRFGPGLIMNEDASGIASVTASIGEAEDGSYLDGLFTDFNPLTPIGTAIDRFNEILSALSPSPAPNLDDLSETITNGITAFLSFGASSDQTSESPAYPSVLDTAGIGDEVDINESYSFTTSGNDIRLGIYDGTQAISGILNDDVSSNNQGGGSYVNYPANSFGDGDTGVLKLEVNGSVVKEIDLTVETGTGTSGAGSASYLNANGSGFTSVSEATNGTFSNGNTFATFKHRTGNYVVATPDQRNGWNYLRVQHVKSGSTTTTNYVEWVNDNNSDALSSSNNNLEFEGSGSIHVSGVEYFQSGTLTYNNKVDNAYKYIYDTNNITFSTSNSATLGSGQSFSFSSQTKPTIDIGSGEDHTKALHLTASSAITANYFINGTVTVGSNVTHPLKSNLSNSGQSTANQILMYNLSNTSTALVETFRRENFRLISGSYDLQGDVTDVANVWDSTIYMTASNAGHSDGLQFYNSILLSPINTLNSGDFSGFSNGPSENPDYSGETGTRTFIRWFKNETGSTQYDLSLAINGSGTLVNEGSTLNTTNITVLIKFPGSTGWMDISQPFTLDSISDGDGAHIDNDDLNFDSTLNATNYINFGNVGIADDDYIVLKVLADESWTGNISQITVAFGAGTGTLSAVPDLDDIDSDNTGDVANLSFGSSKSITGYTNHGTTAGFSAIDLNGLVETAESSNNIRSAVFDGTEIFEGDLNEDISSPGNDYVDNAFSDANSGSLKLEVNGSIVHELEITGSYDLVGTGDPGSGTGTSLNANGSGFISLSNWGPGLFDNGVPRYSEIQRTARYRVTTNDQRNGWNYVRVIHSGTFGERTTNYVEWINDNDSNALSQAGNNLGIFGDNSFSYISGVKYFNSPSGSLETRISNVYRNIYSDSSSAISFTNLTNATASKIIQSGSGLSSTKSTSSSTDSLQTLNTNSDSQNEILHVTGTLNFSRSKSLPGTYTTSYNCAGAMTFVHPLKSNLTTTTQTTTNLLVWTPSDTSNANTDEYFTGETYRLVSGSYTAQSDVSGGTNDWDSQTSMNDQATYPEHATGLLIYDTYLLAPKDGGSSGDFRNHEEGGSIESPAGNVDYSSLTNSTRDYFRSYLNNTTNDRPSVQITIYGDATIVGRVGTNAGTLGSNKNIFVEVGIPGKTGLLDLGRPSAGSGNYNEGDGGLSGDLDATVDGAGAVNTCTFNGRTVDGTVSGAEYLVIRISASENWTGYLDRITVGWS